VRGVIARLIRGLAAAAAAVAFAASLSEAAANQGLTAGAASVQVALPDDTPLAGYGGFQRRAWLPDLLGRFPNAFWFRPSTGVHDPFTVRALVLDSGSTRLLWLAVDLVAVDPSLVAELRDRAGRRGFRYSAVVVSASHTHSGPGAYADSELFAFVAVDRLSRAVRDRLLDGMERVVRDAEARRRPAAIGTGRAEVAGITQSRVRGALDPELGVLRVDGADGRAVALVWNYAIHGTALGWGNSLLSGDLMSDAAARLERVIGAPALYVNGAVADVSPRQRGWAGVAAAGEALAGGALEAWRRIKAETGPRLAVVNERVTLAAPAVSLKNCLGGWAPAAARLGLSGALPSTGEVMALRIGGAAWVTIPGELETRLGLEVKAAGRGRFSHTFVAGVSNDYLGYFLTPEHYRQPSYIACGSLYGERGGEVVRDAAIAALRRLADGAGRR
jgi:neutral ceramidase